MNEDGKLQVQGASRHKSIENENSKPRKLMVKWMDTEDKEKNLKFSRGKSRTLSHKGKQVMLVSDFKTAHLKMK